MIYYYFFALLVFESLYLLMIKKMIIRRNTGLSLQQMTSVQKIKYDRIFLIISGVELILLYSFREVPYLDTTHDLGRYVEFYSAISNGADYSYLEPGFRWYIDLSSFIAGDNTILILLAYSLPVIILICWFIDKYSKNVYLSIYIYYGFMFYFFLFNGVRQCMAMAISLPAFYFIDKGKLIKALFFILLAISFHQSAGILFFLFLLKKIYLKINSRYFTIVIFTSLLMVLLGKAFTNIVTSLLANNYIGYIEDATEGNWANPIIYLSVVGIICLFYKGECQDNERFLVNSIVFGTLIYFMSTQAQILNRMAYYFTLPIICVLPNIINELEDYRIRFFATFGCYLAITVYGVLLVFNNAHGILPYEWAL